MEITRVETPAKDFKNLRLKYTQQKNYHVNNFTVYNLVAFGTFTVLYSHQLCLAPEYFHQPQRKPPAH